MTRAGRQLLVLALIAGTLVAAVLWVGRRAYLRDPPTLTTLDPAAVTSIELDVRPLEPQAFARRTDGWWRTRPGAARAADARVQRLARLAETPVARWLPATGVAPDRLGLDPPSATLVLDGTRLEYGGLSALDGLRYVRVRGRLALVPRQYSPEVTLAQPGAAP